MEQVGRYTLLEEIGSGGMASVYLGRLRGPVGFSKTVAVKRLHPHLAKEGSFVTMLVDEARIVSRIESPHVVQTLDMVLTEGQMLLVLEYVHGESLASLVRDAGRFEPLPPELACAIAKDALRGLHAAHEAQSPDGSPLRIVHRDVSPHNILVGEDGLSRVLDFGIARAMGRLTHTREGALRGKLAYMAPEQVLGGALDCRTDVFALAVVLWELLSGRRLYPSDMEEPRLLVAVQDPSIPALDHVPAALRESLARALRKDPQERYASAASFADALEQTGLVGRHEDVGRWVSDRAGGRLRARKERLASFEATGSMTPSGHAIEEERTETRDVPQAPHPPSTPEPRPRSRRLGVFLAFILIAGILSAATLFRTWPRGVDDHADKAPTQPAGSNHVASVTPTPEPRASAVAEPTPPIASVRNSVPPLDAGTLRVRPTPQGARPMNCDPPYFFDAQGNRRFKRECLR